MKYLSLGLNSTEDVEEIQFDDFNSLVGWSISSDEVEDAGKDSVWLVGGTSLKEENHELFVTESLITALYFMQMLNDRHHMSKFLLFKNKSYESAYDVANLIKEGETELAYDN